MDFAFWPTQSHRLHAALDQTRYALGGGPHWPQRSRRLRLSTMLKNGVRLLSHRLTGEVISPFRGLYACVTRERPMAGEKRLGAAEKFRWMTASARTPQVRYAEFEEGKKGELNGRVRRLHHSSNDLTKVPPPNSPRRVSSAPGVGGRTVYSYSNLQPHHSRADSCDSDTQLSGLRQVFVICCSSANHVCLAPELFSSRKRLARLAKLPACSAARP